MPIVELTLSPQPSHVRMVRLVAVGLARRAGVEDALLDEVRLAVGEACSRAVALHVRAGLGEPVRVELHDESDSFAVVVADRAPGGDAELSGGLEGLDPAALGSPEPEPSTPLPSGFGLAVVSGLVDDCEITRAPDGTMVTLRWKAQPA